MPTSITCYLSRVPLANHKTLMVCRCRSLYQAANNREIYITQVSKNQACLRAWHSKLNRFVGEESYSKGASRDYLIDDSPTWCVDPLDGKYPKSQSHIFTNIRCRDRELHPSLSHVLRLNRLHPQQQTTSRHYQRPLPQAILLIMCRSRRLHE